MFTGLIEATGTITKITDLGDQARYEIAIPFAKELALGDSVATNGCRLTVAALSDPADDRQGVQALRLFTWSSSIRSIRCATATR